MSDKQASHFEDPCAGQSALMPALDDLDQEAFKDLVSDYPIAWPTETNQEAAAEFWKSKSPEEARRLTASYMPASDTTKEMWESEKQASEAASAKKEKEQLLIQKTMIFGRSKRKARITESLDILQLEREASMLTLADKAMDAEEGGSVRINKRAPAYSRSCRGSKSWKREVQRQRQSKGERDGTRAGARSDGRGHE
jgi:hypothetical protein